MTKDEAIESAANFEMAWFAEKQRAEKLEMQRNDERIQKTKAQEDYLSAREKLEAAELREKKLVEVTSERVAQLIAHRACCGVEHDPSNGKLHGCCVVCGVSWPCEYAGSPPILAANAEAEAKEK